MKNNKKLFNKVIKQKGNCEDLFFNYEFKKIYNKKPIKVEGYLKNLDDSDGFSTTENNGHYIIRKNFCNLISK